MIEVKAAVYGTLKCMSDIYKSVTNQTNELHPFINLLISLIY